MNFLEQIKINCRKTPFFSLIFGFLLLGIGFIFLNPLAWLLLSSLYGINQESMREILQHTDLFPANRNLLLSIIGLTQVFTWGFAGWTMIGLNGDEIQTPLHKRFGPTTYIGILMMFAAIPLIQTLAFNSDTFSLPEGFDGLESWIKSRESQSFDMIRSFIITQDFSCFLINLLMLALVPAVCEEMFFRGFIQKTLEKTVSPLTALFLTAFIFSFMHFQFFGFFSRLFLGCILGYLFYLTKSIFPGILAHFAYNGLMVFMGYGAGLTNHPFPEGEAKGHYPWYWVGLSLLLTLGLGWSLYRMYFPEKET